MKKIILTLGVLLLSFYFLQLLNHLILEKVIIGDECAYDTNNIKTSTVFNLFYEISSNTGYHPEPSYFNFIFTEFLGIVLGIILSLKFIWMKKAQSHNKWVAKSGV